MWWTRTGWKWGSRQVTRRGASSSAWMVGVAQCAILCGGAAAAGAEAADATAASGVHLSVRRPDRVHEVARLVVEGGAPHGWSGFFVALAGAGSGALGWAERVAPGVGELRGDVARWVRCDEDGRAELELSALALASGARVQALVLPANRALSRARTSDPVTLVPLERGSAAGSGPRVFVTEFLKDPTAVSDTVGEWFEVHNPGPGSIDITGWVLSDLGSESTVLSNGGLRIAIGPGKHVVLGRSADLTVNGGVPVNFTYTGFTLSNGDDEIQLTRPDGTLVDLVAYDDGVLWPDQAGRSISHDPDLYGELTNDDPANWCHSMRRLAQGSPDSGTPGKRNEDCP